MARQRGFEVVYDQYRKHLKFDEEIKLPTRSDNGSAGYDFYAPTDYECRPYTTTKIWTDVKSYMLEDEVLLLNIRSSMGGKFRLANTLGVIDSSYYNNMENDGNIGIFLINDTDEIQYIHKGDRIAQGIFTKYLVVDNDKVVNSNRLGGFGSSGR